MHVREYLGASEREWPPPGSPGVESGWMDFAELVVKSGSVWVGPIEELTSTAGLLVKVPKGKAVVRAKGMDFAGHRRVSRLRVFAAPGGAGAGAVRRGRKVGEVASDRATLAVCDLAAMEKNYSKKEKAGAVQRLMLKAAERQGEYSQLCVTLDDGTGHMVAYSLSGLGDGTYPAFQVKRGEAVVGVEVVFMGNEVPRWEQTLNARQIGA